MDQNDSLLLALQKLGLVNSDELQQLQELLTQGSASTLEEALRTLGILDEGTISALVTLSQSARFKRLEPQKTQQHETTLVNKVQEKDQKKALLAPIIEKPEILGNYVVLRQIARGSSGFVFQACHSSSQDEVALKVFPLSLAKDDREVLRFQREVETIMRLHHPHIVKVVDFGSGENYLYYAMELLPGKSLRDLLSERGHFSFYEAAEYIQEAAEGLAYAHQCGIIHRDIKPSNLMLSDKGIVKVVDFGVALEKNAATLTATGFAAGTPAYMAPEQIDSGGIKIDERSDIYSLGVTFYELLAGQRPFQGQSHYQIMRHILSSQPEELRKVVPGLPQELHSIVTQMMTRHPAERYQSMPEVINALRGFLDKNQKDKN